MPERPGVGVELEGPEMDPLAELLAKVAHPRQAGMGGLRPAVLHIEVEDGLRAAALLSQPPPAGIPHARGAVATQSVSDEVNLQVTAIGWPVVLEVVEERGPVGREAVDLEVAKWK